MLLLLYIEVLAATKSLDNKVFLVFEPVNQINKTVLREIISRHRSSDTDRIFDSSMTWRLDYWKYHCRCGRIRLLREKIHQWHN
jgi:hypothetical protein